MPSGIKAELIEGVVYMPSPVTTEEHGDPHFDLIYWLGIYRAQTPGVRGGDNSTLRLDLDNEPQPDAHLRILTEHGGQSRIEDGYVVGATELIAEVAASTVSYDLHEKLNAYRRNGVKEYVVWRVLDLAIDWFILADGRYERLPPNTDGIYQSRVFPGLWLDHAALIRADMARVLQVAQQGLASPEYNAFRDRLQASGPV
jgi:Uma2 family endonuclease